LQLLFYLLCLPLPTLLLSFRSEAEESAVLFLAVPVTLSLHIQKLFSSTKIQKDTPKNTSKFACQSPKLEIPAPILHNRVAYEFHPNKYTRK
jgi:hypothetical protein